MRIVEVIPTLVSGGGERFVVDLCNQLSKEGNEVKLVVLTELSGDLAFFQKDVVKDVEIICLNKKFGFDLKTFFHLYRLVKKQKPDVVHFHLRALVYGFLSVLLNRKPKYFHTVHNDATREASGDWLSVFVRKFSFRNQLVFPVTISVESESSFVDYYGFDAPMIDNGRNVSIDYDDSCILHEFDIYRKTSNTRVFCNLARFAKQKRQPLIAKVCKRLEKEGYDFAMLFVGSLVQKELVEETKAVGCKSIYILGEKTNSLDYLRASDAFCLLSEYEGMPIALIEALGVGAVPVCTPVGGIIDVVSDGENGFLASDISEEACYKALKSFLETSDARLVEMKKNAIKAYEPYSMTECAKKYLELFEK